MDYSKIILNKGKEFSLQRMHPWVFSGAIAKKDSNLADGDIVEIYSHQNQFLGMGYYSGGGSISVRIISFVKTIIDEDFWFEKINKAYQYRLQLFILNEKTNVCRLFFGEGDGVPGLILDYYDGNVVFQAHSWGVYLQKDNITTAIKRVLGTIYLKQTLNFLKPMYVDTTYEAVFTVKEVLKDKHRAIVETTIKDKTTGNLCTSGEATVLNTDKI